MGHAPSVMAWPESSQSGRPSRSVRVVSRSGPFPRWPPWAASAVAKAAGRDGGRVRKFPVNTIFSVLNQDTDYIVLYVGASAERCAGTKGAGHAAMAGDEEPPFRSAERFGAIGGSGFTRQ